MTLPERRIALVVGTRPEAIKIAPIYFAMKESPLLRPIILASGQHRQMLDQTLQVFGITPDADLNLMTPGQSLSALTSRVVTAVSDWIEGAKIDAVLVQGDTTTVLAAALAAFYQRVPLGHVEAGLRTGTIDSPFPEEMNRRLTTPLARWNFCPTSVARENLLRENVDPSSIHVTGNTVVDALLWVRDRLASSDDGGCGSIRDTGVSESFASRYLSDDQRRWILVTGHRRESFGEGFEQICHGIRTLVDRYEDLGVLYPVHMNPQVREPVQRILGEHPRIALIEPVAYLPFVYLMSRATLILTDSGGVQEEAPSLGKPVLVMRESTERPEAIEAGTCRLVGADADRIVAETSLLLDSGQEYSRRCKLNNPYGDGHAGQRIAAILEHNLNSAAVGSQ